MHRHSFSGHGHQALPGRRGPNTGHDDSSPHSSTLQASMPSERDAALQCHRVLWPPCQVCCIPLWRARCRKRGLSPAERSRYGPHFECSASCSRLLKEAGTAKSSSLARHDSFSSVRPGSHSDASRPLQHLRTGHAASAGATRLACLLPRRRAPWHGAVPCGQACGFLLSPICGITSPTGFALCSHRLLHAASA